MYPLLLTIKVTITTVNLRFKDVCNRLEERESKLDTVIENAEEFQTASDEFADWLKDATRIAHSYAPIGQDPDVLKNQLNEVEVIFKTSLVITSCWSSPFL